MSVAEWRRDPIDLERVVIDPEYRRAVIEWLNGGRSGDGPATLAQRLPSGGPLHAANSPVFPTTPGSQETSPPPLDEPREP
jgi:hypothetical protein